MTYHREWHRFEVRVLYATGVTGEHLNTFGFDNRLSISDYPSKAAALQAAKAFRDSKRMARPKSTYIVVECHDAAQEVE